MWREGGNESQFRQMKDIFHYNLDDTIARDFIVSSVCLQAKKIDRRKWNVYLLENSRNKVSVTEAEIHVMTNPKIEFLLMIQVVHRLTFYHSISLNLQEGIQVLPRPVYILLIYICRCTRFVRYMISNTPPPPTFSLYKHMQKKNNKKNNLEALLNIIQFNLFLIRGPEKYINWQWIDVIIIHSRGRCEIKKISTLVFNTGSQVKVCNAVMYLT